jgi:DNA-binding NarL/FixJ family response regulator
MNDERPLKLGGRQSELIKLSALGYSDKQIADKMGIKVTTVIAVRTNIRVKANAHGYKWAKVLVDADGNQLRVDP